MDRMKQRLLHKTLKVHLLYAALILVVTAPLFYVFTQHWYRAEAHEALRQRVTAFETGTLPTLRLADTLAFNQWNPDAHLETCTGSARDAGFHEISLQGGPDGDVEHYVTLRQAVTIEGHPMDFVTRVNLLDNMDTIRNIATLYVFILGLMLIGLIVITRWETVRLWRPYNRTLAALENFEIDKPAVTELPESDVEEFHRLKLVVEKLVTRNLRIYEDQREFVENAAHELQTPLAILRGRLDNLIQDSGLNEHQSAALAEFSDSIQRLSHLNKNLLMLSRLDHDRYSGGRSFDILPILRDQLDFLEEQAREMGISVKYDHLEASTVTADPVLFEVLTSNLLSNALRHNRNGGRLEVELTKGRFSVRNTGNTGALDRDKLFKRFSRLADGGKGTGLGLAIARKIADRYGWILEYQYHEGEHVFTLSFMS